MSNPKYVNAKNPRQSYIFKKLTRSLVSTQPTIQSFAIFLWSWCRISSFSATLIPSRPTILVLHFLIDRGPQIGGTRSLSEWYVQHGGISLGRLLSSGQPFASGFKICANLQNWSLCFYVFNYRALCLFIFTHGSHGIMNPMKTTTRP